MPSTSTANPDHADRIASARAADGEKGDDASSFSVRSVNSSRIGSIQGEGGDSVIATNDPRPEIATFRRRQVQMLPICVMVGTGLLYQSGKLLAVGGPVSLVLAYLLMGSVTYSLQVRSGRDPLM